MVEREAVARYVALFDVALQPDVVAYASPLKLFEYMGLRRPIVAPDTDNVREVLTHERDALLFDRARDGAFVDAVETLVNDETLRERLGREAGETLRRGNYTWENNARRVAELAHALTAAPPGERSLDRA